MGKSEDERDRACRQGTQAWQRLKKEKSWMDWLKVGEALQVGREWAMNQAGNNRPEGKGYNTAFGEWLAKYKLDHMDKGDRSRLFSVMDNLPSIEGWRQTLTLTERLKLNHPNAVLRKWKAYIEPEDAKPTLRDSVANLSEDVEAKNRETAALKEHIAELEAARAMVEPGRRPMTEPNSLDDVRKAYISAAKNLTKEGLTLQAERPPTKRTERATRAHAKRLAKITGSTAAERDAVGGPEGHDSKPVIRVEEGPLEVTDTSFRVCYTGRTHTIFSGSQPIGRVEHTTDVTECGRRAGYACGITAYTVKNLPRSGSSRTYLGDFKTVADAIAAITK